MRTRGFIAVAGFVVSCAAAAVAACVGGDPEPTTAQPDAGTGPTPTEDSSTAPPDAGDAAPAAFAFDVSIATPIPRDSTVVQISLTVGGVDEDVTVQLVNPPTGITATPKTILRTVTQDKMEVRADGNAVPGFNVLELVAATKSGATVKKTLRAAVLGMSGTLDPTMGDGGVMTSTFANAFGQVGVLDGDDKVVVAGNVEAAGQGQFGLMRFMLEDGAPDPTWNGGNPTVTTIGTTSDILALARQTDGKIVAAGWTGTTATGAVARYDTNGTLDTTFGGTNTGFITFGLGGSNDIIRTVGLQSDGKIVVGGQASVGGVGLFAMMRLKTDGTIDSSFGTDGGVVGPYGSAVSKPGIRELAVYGSSGGERIVVAGSDGDAGSENVRVARYQLSGQPDPTGSSGFVPPSIDWNGANESVGGLYVYSTGLIVVGGSVPGGPTDHGYARIGTGGALDTNFGVGGKIVASFGGIDEMESLAVQSDGKVLAGGKAGNGWGQITRIVSTGPDAGPDLTFNSVGALRMPTGTSPFVVSILIQKDERILLVLNGKPFRLARAFK